MKLNKENNLNNFYATPHKLKFMTSSNRNNNSKILNKRLKRFAIEYHVRLG